jgi:hypothetical protein
MSTRFTVTLTLSLLAASAAVAADRTVVVSSEEGCTLYVEGTNLVAEGCNMHIRNDSGKTDTIDGTGNLIIGHDEADAEDDKTGSHNLVVGPLHSYSSHGGLLAGADNDVSAPSATISGGYSNRAAAQS